MVIDHCICMSCLSRHIKMHPISTHLTEFYKRLNNIHLSEDKVPKSICYICYSQLQKCYKFMEMSRKAEKILTRLNSDSSIQIKQEIEAFNLESTNNFVKTILNPITVPFSSGDKEESIETFPNDGIINAIHVEIQDTRKKTISTYKRLEEIDVQIEIKDELVSVKGEILSTEREPSTSAQANEFDVLIKKEITEDAKNIQSDLEGEQNMDESVTVMIRELKDHKSKEICEKIGSKKHISKEKSHVCIRCGKGFTHGYYLKRHMVSHTGEKQFACKTCNKSFTQNGHLLKHMRSHTGEELYVCELCCKTFKHRYNFKVHMRKHTPENLLSSPTLSQEKLQKSHKCDLCSSAFYNKGDLQRHIRAHTGEKPFICNYCDAKFSQKGHLREHIRTHTNEKPYTCNFCKLTFSQKYYLDNHIAEHTGGRLYPCVFPGCNKSFQTKTTIANHMRVHTGERPFACDKCNKTYKQKGHLTTHYSAVHAKEEIENDLLAAQNQ